MGLGCVGLFIFEDGGGLGRLGAVRRKRGRVGQVSGVKVVGITFVFLPVWFPFLSRFLSFGSIPW